MPLKDIIQSNVASIPLTGTLKQAATLMHKKHVGTVVVVDKALGANKIPKGIITDRDIALSLAKKSKFDPSCSVAEVMNKNVVMCSSSDGIYETIQKMSSNGIRRIPVVNKKDHLVGIIASDDLLKLLSDELSEVSNIITSETRKEKKIPKSNSKGRQVKATRRML